MECWPQSPLGAQQHQFKMVHGTFNEHVASAVLRLPTICSSAAQHSTKIAKLAKTLMITGERGRIRTCDPCLKRALLYHLSYAPTADPTC